MTSYWYSLRLSIGRYGQRVSHQPIPSFVAHEHSSPLCRTLQMTSREPKMNFEQPPPYPGNGPSAPGYPAQGPPPQGFPPQGYPQGYPVNMEQPNPAYPNYPAGPMGPGGPYPGPGQPPYGYPGQPQPQFGWQGGPPPGPMYGEAPKNTGECVRGGGQEKRRHRRHLPDSLLDSSLLLLSLGHADITTPQLFTPLVPHI
ncbi:hypothetical protein FQN60_009845, partial [Etheostoma spectabile]